MKISTNFRFEMHFHQRIKQAAKAREISLTAWVISACREKLIRDARPADRA